MAIQIPCFLAKRKEASIISMDGMVVLQECPRSAWLAFEIAWVS